MTRLKLAYFRPIKSPNWYCLQEFARDLASLRQSPSKILNSSKVVINDQLFLTNDKWQQLVITGHYKS